jgi:hypothetical protein
MGSWSAASVVVSAFVAAVVVPVQRHPHHHLNHHHHNRHPTVTQISTLQPCGNWTPYCDPNRIGPRPCTSTICNDRGPSGSAVAPGKTPGGTKGCVLTSGRNNNSNSDDASLSEETRLKLTLKTKIFHDDDELLVDVVTRRTESASGGNEDSNDNGNNDDDDDDALSSMSTGARCVICLLRLADGDVIGDIPCGHLLHKACLKDWVRRKNKCPLCQHVGIATLSLERVPVTTTGGGPSTLSSST